VYDPAWRDATAPANLLPFAENAVKSCPAAANWLEVHRETRRQARKVQNSIDKGRGVGENSSNQLDRSFPMTPLCKHPIVKVVAREDDAEFVECQTCGEVFDSAEYNDMAIEEIEEKAAAESTDD
jgi:hypothetical protein